MTLKQIFFYLILISIVGAVIERLLKPHKSKRRRFSWLHYIFFISFPLSISAVLIYGYSRELLLVFMLSMLIGIVFEWLFGYYYKEIVGQKLWEYKRYSINGYTSWLALPLWGSAGVLFAFMTKIILG